MMKIGIVSKFPPEQDGIGLYSDYLCANLEIKGCKIVRIGDLLSGGADYQINFKSFHLRSLLSRIIEKENLDLLHIQYIAPYFGRFTLNLNLLDALKQKVPVVVTLHEVHASNKGLRQKVLLFLQERIVQKASVIIAHTKIQAGFIRHLYSNDSVYHINMGLSEYHKMHKLNEGDKTLLFFGMLNFGKGAEYLIRAMDYLPRHKLIVAGKCITKKYEDILRETHSRCVNGNVSLELGWASERRKDELLTIADVMIFPYVWAPYQSAVLHDAFSYGIPVVVTDAGAIHEAVHEYGCGAVVHPYSPELLAEGVMRVFENYGNYQEGVGRYRRDAGWSHVAAQHIRTYEDAISKRRGEYNASNSPE